MRQGFTQSKQDYSLFTKGILGSGSFLAVLVYVDDVLITEEAEQSILDLKRKLHYTFTIKDLGHVRYFLGYRSIPQCGWGNSPSTQYP